VCRARTYNEWSSRHVRRDTRAAAILAEPPLEDGPLRLRRDRDELLPDRDGLVVLARPAEGGGEIGERRAGFRVDGQDSSEGLDRALDVPRPDLGDAQVV